MPNDNGQEGPNERLRAAAAAEATTASEPQHDPILAESLVIDDELPSSAAESTSFLNDDDPPPYSSLIGSSASPWSYGYLGGDPIIGGGRAIARPLVSIPLTSYRIFKIEPPRYTSVDACIGSEQAIFPRICPGGGSGSDAEARPPAKSSNRTARKYGAILIAAAVIIFLMVLSLLVRFVTEKSLWRS
ncbi:hypothetical protein TKK_0009195 [Trichogramma kaykai]